MKFLGLFLSLLLSINVSAKIKRTRDGNAVGNGGGAICINGKCQTLIEAGLRINPEYDGVWLPTQSHYQLVKQRVQKNLVLTNEVKSNIFSMTFGRADHFRRVDVIDESKVEAIKKLYLETAEQSGFHIDPTTFKVVAFSSDNTVQPAMTYLLPAFFDLDADQQAAFLIHEGLYRGRPSSHLKYVLQLESSMEEIMKRAPDLQIHPSYPILKTCIDQQMISYRLGLMTKDAMIGYILSLIVNGYSPDATEVATKLSDFGVIDFHDLNNNFQLDHDKLLSFGEVEPRLPYMFSKVDQLPLAKYTKQSHPENGEFLVVDWNKLKPAQFLDCSEFHPSYYSCDSYQIQDPESVPLVLPN